MGQDGLTGMGTMGPAYSLHVKRDVDDYLAKFENSGNSTSSDGVWIDTRWNTSTNTVFKVTSNQGASEYLNIDGSGTTTIRKEANISGHSATLYPLVLEANDSDGGFWNYQGCGIKFQNSASHPSNPNGPFVAAEIVGQAPIAADVATEGTLIFKTLKTSIDAAPTEKMRIEGSGRVIVDKASNSVIAVLTSATTITLDMDDASNFSLTLDHDTTLADPDNMTAGQSGCIVITQGSTGGTMGYGTKWHFEGGTAPTLSTGTLVDNLVYYVASTGSIHAVLLKDLKTTA
jgi:hypothetical protein